MKMVRDRLLLVLFCLFSLSCASAVELRPYVLSSNVAGDRVQKAIQIRDALLAEGFEWVGEYLPDPERHILIFTHDHLKRIAGGDPGGYFLLPVRVAITRVNGKLQVSYANLIYYAHAFRIQSDVHAVQARLQRVLGAQQTFGAQGLTPEVLSNYRYSYGMERFDDLLHLAHFDSQEQALEVLERGLERHSGYMERVYRLDLPGQAAALFGVAIKHGPGSDQAILSGVDVAPLRHTARMPYSLLVRHGEVVALHPRFRLPLDFPDLARTGDHSFTAIMAAPGAIEQSLRSLFEGAAE